MLSYHAQDSSINCKAWKDKGKSTRLDSSGQVPKYIRHMAGVERLTSIIPAGFIMTIFRGRLDVQYIL
jgi:hypothetical protein